MSSSAESSVLVCELHSDSVQGIINALSIVRCERNQDDAVLLLNKHRLILIVQEESGGSHPQASVTLLQQVLFVRYKYAADPIRIGDCLEAFNGQSSAIEFRYPGPEK